VSRPLQGRTYGLAGIDLITGKVDRHRSREFIEFLELSRRRPSGPDGDQADPRQSFCAYLKETRGWLAGQSAHRFEFTFALKHGSWLNLVEGIFSKLARSVLRHIRAASKEELKDRSWPPWIISTAIPSCTPGRYKVDRTA
jgi:hypothetical protein